MSSSKLKLNLDKAEFIIFGCKYQRHRLSEYSPVNILGNLISPALVIRYPGMLFHSEFYFTSHIQSVSRVSRVRNTSQQNFYFKIMIGSHLDYCNAHIGGLSPEVAVHPKYSCQGHHQQ